ncbi:MAG: hypothetical protein IKX33_08760 [Prevotella sp.]|nr:hypothetical protein [Prevotella sp.]
MKYSIALKDLPFEPESKQVIYIENQYDERINALIRAHYNWFKEVFCWSGLDFIYLPMLFLENDVREKVLYYAPYLTEEALGQTKLRSSFLLNFMSHQENREKIQPSFLFAPRIENDEWIFSGQTIWMGFGEWNLGMRYFYDVIFDIKEKTSHFPKVGKKSHNYDSGVRFSIEERDVSIDDVVPCIIKKPEEDVEDVLESLERKIEHLILLGIPIGVIRELIDKYEKISRLYITDNLRILLPDYNNIEVKMTAQQKAVYLLFLYHPEGIILKRLDEYHKELVYFYKKTSNVENLTPRMSESIKKMEGIGNNYLNTILAKIRAAFVETFDEHMAKHYYIQGKPGEPYKIPLDKELVSYEEDK